MLAENADKLEASLDVCSTPITQQDASYTADRVLAPSAVLLYVAAGF